MNKRNLMLPSERNLLSKILFFILRSAQFIWADVNARVSKKKKAIYLQITGRPPTTMPRSGSPTGSTHCLFPAPNISTVTLPRVQWLHRVLYGEP